MNILNELLYKIENFDIEGIEALKRNTVIKCLLGGGSRVTVSDAVGFVDSPVFPAILPRIDSDNFLRNFDSLYHIAPQEFKTLIKEKLLNVGTENMRLMRDDVDIIRKLDTEGITELVTAARVQTIEEAYSRKNSDIYLLLCTQSIPPVDSALFDSYVERSKTDPRWLLKCIAREKIAILPEIFDVTTNRMIAHAGTQSVQYVLDDQMYLGGEMTLFEKTKGFLVFDKNGYLYSLLYEYLFSKNEDIKKKIIENIKEYDPPTFWSGKVENKIIRTALYNFDDVADEEAKYTLLKKYIVGGGSPCIFTHLMNIDCSKLIKYMNKFSQHAVDCINRTKITNTKALEPYIMNFIIKGKVTLCDGDRLSLNF